MNVMHTCTPTHFVQAYSTIYKCLCVPFALSGWLVFMFCNISLCTLIFLMKGPEIVQNHFHESKESIQRKVEMLL